MGQAELWQNPMLILFVLFLAAVFVKSLFGDKKRYEREMAEWEAKQAAKRKP